ncbi:MAG: TonB-dependent receptor [Tannerella sp.]|jgi:outer membrane cobalamin receptor|nr:TonB-dependent receptor [Tannerella sp.]
MFFGRIFCASVLLTLPAVSSGQSKLDSVQHIDEVEIVASRYREIIPAQRLSGRKLESLNSFSVADAIRYFSGIQIKNYGGVGGLKTVDIRSMGTNHTGVFYDGIPLGNAQNGQIDLGRFSLDNIEEISLYNGQKSDIFQPAKDFGSAGTIYLRTRRPRFTGSRKTNIRLFSRTGSFDLANPSVLWEQKVGENTSASFNAEYISSSGKYRFRYRKVLHNGSTAWDTTAVRRNGDIHSLRLEGGFNGFVEQGRWHLKSYFYDSEKGIPGAIVNNVWKRSQRQWDRNFFTQAGFQKELFKGGELLVNAKYADDRMRYLNPDTTLMYIDNTFRQQEIYASTAGKYTVLPNWDVALSVDWQWNILHADLQDFVYPKRNTLLVALATAFGWKRFKGQASLLGTFVSENVTRIRHGDGELLPGVRTGIPDNKQEYTPAVFVSWQPFTSPAHLLPLRLRAFYKRIFRMPTFNDLYYTDAGNIALRPEYTTQYNAGLQYEKNLDRGIIRHLNFHADVYYNEVTDKIIAVPKGNGQYRWMMMNIGYVEIRGVDISGQTGWQLPHEIQVNTSLNYTFQRAQDFSNPADSDPQAGTWGGQIAYIPWHSGSAIVNTVWKSWDLNYSFIYAGARYHNSSNIRENHEQPWYTHDLTIGKTFDCRKIKCRLSAEINNIFNQYYDVIQNYPMPGRNYKLILKVEI